MSTKKAMIINLRISRLRNSSNNQVNINSTNQDQVKMDNLHKEQ